MNALKYNWSQLLIAAVLAVLALVPLSGDGYHLSLGIGILNYLVMATAWALFSGATGYISLATSAFFGIGAYAAAALGEVLPWPAVLLVAALVGAAVAFIVGLSTLRLSGIYFVIFSFGLAELIRQLVTWYEVNVAGSVGRYVFLDISHTAIFWQLFALAVAVFVIGFLIYRSRWGVALRVIGEDEVVAQHCGIDTARAKLMLFVLSAVFMTLTGAIMAPRWTYIDPAIAFNPLISFQVVIMALLGGAGLLYGPLLGVVPLVLLFDLIGAHFPNYFSILLGLIFIVIVYGIPKGIAGLLPLEQQPAAELAAKADPRAADTDDANRPKADSNPLLTISGLSRAFGGLRAVDDLGFTVDRGMIIGLIGPNGSGKTSALNLISGLLKPDRGEVRFDGAAISGLRADRIAKCGVARTFQLVRVIDDLSCAQNILAAIAWRAQPKWGAPAWREALTWLDRVGLKEQADLPAAKLTYIDRKRLELARALALQPKLLLLDEWLAGLNPTELQSGIALIASLRRDGLTIVMVEHVMDAIRSLCDRCVVMNAGRKIADGTTAEALSSPDVIRAYLGEDDA